MFSTLAYENKKGNQPNHDLDKETYIARDTWMYMCMYTCTVCAVFLIHQYVQVCAILVYAKDIVILECLLILVGCA